MQADAIRQMTDGEIRSALEDVKAELFNLRFQREVGTLEDYSRLRALRKDVARLKTVLRERQLAAAVVQEEMNDAE